MKWHGLTLKRLRRIGGSAGLLLDKKILEGFAVVGDYVQVVRKGRFIILTMVKEPILNTENEIAQAVRNA
jgi:hypothetical protein